ncbi:hypothetical protein [Methylopila sp. Yamaguchi]|uniref:hypothetical protein n=1 Tax=Methylopila sp. Yamaguchi TaxID=1437817 RepID=UPI000CA6831B|nr:hypothetical protein [Methylopila sp. Yamaguchi]GBD49965.1 hypothetical protein METY_3178 [Methylopila sp. Yamaguchi]
MDEREKIIREDYPVDRLPEDLRAELGDATRVRVTVERAIDSDERKSWAEIEALIEELHRSPGFKPVTTDEAVARVRELRDEWDR